jgi:hypothetical protein
MHLLATSVIVVASTVVNPGITSAIAPKPKQIKPNPQNQGAGNKPATPAKKPMVQVRQGKLNFTTMGDIPEGASVLTGTFSINDTPAKILFDSGATHSFISEKTNKQNRFKGFSYQFRLQDNYSGRASHI